MPTPKQLATFHDVVDNKMPVSVAMRKNGYSPQTATHPKHLTDSDGWKELVNKYLPDHKLLKKHEQALDATKWNDFTGEREPDHQTRLKAIEMAYKLTNKSADNSRQSYQQINISIEGSGYIPSNNVLNLKPTLASSKYKRSYTKNTT